jgi:GrpB-like predicted nucleotidyltransferase (UPF0157 family)
MSNYRIDRYDPDWPRLARDEMVRIAAALGLDPGKVEHVGSTAVAGLGAKPIIDIMAGITGFSGIEDKRPVWKPLESLGYDHRGIETVPGTLYIRKAEPRRYNLHMTEYGNEFWISHMLFRDYLRSHAEVARQYEDLKRRLMADLGPEPDQAAYNERKSAFIAGVIARARAEMP